VDDAFEDDAANEVPVVELVTLDAPPPASALARRRARSCSMRSASGER